MDSRFDSSNPLGGPSDIHSLARNLKNRDLSLASAIYQVSSLVREVLKITEEYANEQTKAIMEQELKVVKMDKIINDLSKECQRLQQEVLYKEEKYDEIYREVQKYKIISGITATVSGSDNPYYRNHDQNNNIVDNSDTVDRKAGVVKLGSQCRDQSVPTQDGGRRFTKEHTKLSRDQVHMSESVDPFPAESSSFSTRGPASVYDYDDRRSLLACHYAGGPNKRPTVPTSQILPSNQSAPFQQQDSRVKAGLETIGAINVRGPHYKRPSSDSYSDDQNKRVKITSLGQSNEVFSSTGDIAHQLRQNVYEKDHCRHIMAGTWTKLSSRRKKGHPFVDTYPMSRS